MRRNTYGQLDHSSMESVLLHATCFVSCWATRKVRLGFIMCSMLVVIKAKGFNEEEELVWKRYPTIFLSVRRVFRRTHNKDLKMDGYKLPVIRHKKQRPIDTLLLLSIHHREYVIQQIPIYCIVIVIEKVYISTKFEGITSAKYWQANSWVRVDWKFAAGFISFEAPHDLRSSYQSFLCC